MEFKEYERLAHRAYRQGKYKEAAKYFERACEQRRDKRTLYWTVLCFYKLEKHQQAIDRFSQALAMDAKFKEALVAKGDALCSCKGLEKLQLATEKLSSLSLGTIRLERRKNS